MRAVFLDLETTGLDPQQHIPIDLAFKVADLKSDRVLCSYQSLIKPAREAWSKCDPVSMEVNGYQWEHLQKGKELEVVGDEVIALLQDVKIVREKAVFICQNPAFDRAFFTQIVPVYTQERLFWPYHWLDLASMYWAKQLSRLSSEGLQVPDSLSLSKNSIAKAYCLPPEEKPHKAMNGVEHLIACYRAVMGESAPSVSE